jgi:hypothetical protein
LSRFRLTSYTLTMETAASYKMAVTIYEPTRRHIPEGHNLNMHCHGNLRSRKKISLVCVRKGSSKAIDLLLSDNAFFFLFFFLGWGKTESTSHAGHCLACCTRWVWSIWWNGNWQRKPKYSEKTCSSSTLSTTNPTCLELGSNQGCRGGQPANNRLSSGTASFLIANASGNIYLCENYCRFLFI